MTDDLEKREKRAELERAIRHHHDQRGFDAAVSEALRGYGPEVFEFLIALHRDEEDASEVFSVFAEGLWRGIAAFEWKSSFRTWAYVIARRASARYRRSSRDRAARFASFPERSDLSVLAQEVQAQTLSYLRPQRRERLVELRESLPKKDQVLLMLRVDRELSWNDLARVLYDGEGDFEDEELAGALREVRESRPHEGEATLEGEALIREAARLRQRFQAVKARLYEMARREGLVGPREEK